MSFRLRLNRRSSALAVVGGAFLLAEVALRIARFHSPPSEKPIAVWNSERDAALESKSGLLVRDSSTLWSLRPGAEIPTPPREDGVERVNAAGWRGPLVPFRSAGRTLRILTLGDSAAFGAGVRYEETFSSRLSSKLTEAGLDVEVIDGGVEGYTIRQGLERYRSLFRPYRPDLVIAAFSGINDATSACDLADNEKIRTLAQRDRGFAGIKRSVREHLRTWQLATWFLHQRARAEVQAASDAERQRERELAAESGRTDWPGVRRVSPSAFASGLAELHRATSADGARLILIAMPIGTDAAARAPVLRQYSRAVFNTAVSEDVQVLDARARFESRVKHAESDAGMFLDDCDPTPFGHELIAQWLVPLVRDALRNRGRDPLEAMR